MFLDANVLQDAVFERPVITSQTFRLPWPWGTYTHDIATTIPSYKRCEGWLQQEIDCLPQIAELIRRGRFEAYINTELDFELAEGRSGAFITSELSIFHGISLLRVPAPFRYSRLVGSSSQTSKELRELRDRVFTTNFDQRFSEIKRAAGGTKNVDAFHILSAERARLDYFVTLDKKLINSLRNQRRVQLGLKVLLPSELLRDAGH